VAYPRNGRANVRNFDFTDHSKPSQWKDASGGEIAAVECEAGALGTREPIDMAPTRPVGGTKTRKTNLMQTGARDGNAGARGMPAFVWALGRSQRARLFAFWRDHPIVVLCAVALAVRIVFILMYGASAPPIEWGDDPKYDSIALRLVVNHEYVNTWYPPGYPLVLAAIYTLFGRNLPLVRLAQAALGAATCALTYRLGTKVFDERVGRLAGTILAFYPGLAYMSWRIMGETLFIFLIVLALNIAVRMAARPRMRDAVALGIVVGTAQLVKSNLFVFPAVLVVWSVLALKGSARRRLALAGGLSVGLLVLALATPVANFLSTGGGAATLPGNAGRTFWMANNPLADGYYIFAENEPAGKAFIEANGFTQRLAQGSDFEKDRLFGELGLLWIRENPEQFLVLCLKKLNNAFGLFPRAVTLQGNPSAQAVHLLTYGLIAPFALLGMLSAGHRWRVCLPPFLVLFSYVLMVLIYYGTPRFTIIVIPVLAIFASSAIWICAHYVARARQILTVGRATPGFNK
jgi:Dolichyl-phosphate-mannose-protein mannosyltransferase